MILIDFLSPSDAIVAYCFCSFFSIRTVRRFDQFLQQGGKWHDSRARVHATSCGEPVICATMRIASRTRLASTNYYPHEIHLFLPVLNATSSTYSRTELHGLKITGGGDGSGGSCALPGRERRINRHRRGNNPVAK